MNKYRLRGLIIGFLVALGTFWAMMSFHSPQPTLEDAIAYIFIPFSAGGYAIGLAFNNFIVGIHRLKEIDAVNSNIPEEEKKELLKKYSQIVEKVGIAICLYVISMIAVYFIFKSSESYYIILAVSSAVLGVMFLAPVSIPLRHYYNKLIIYRITLPLDLPSHNSVRHFILWTVISVFAIVFFLTFFLLDRDQVDSVVILWGIFFLYLGIVGCISGKFNKKMIEK